MLEKAAKRLTALSNFERNELHAECARLRCGCLAVCSRCCSWCKAAQALAYF